MPIHPLSYSLPTAWEAAVDGWLVWLVAAGTSPATRKTRRSHIRRVARGLGADHPGDVTSDGLLAILGRPEFSIEHRRGLRASLGSFYRWCVSAAVVATDPTLVLPTVRTPAGAPRPATDEIWRDILDKADERTRLMARLACEAGLRRAEVAAVHANDLIRGDDGAELIVHGKGGKQRVVPITTSLAAVIEAACPLGGFLFPGKIDGHISHDRVGHLVSKVMPKGWSIHKLRHRFATRGYAGTGNLRAVQECLGHASVATTQRYVAVAAREIRAVAEAAGSTDNTVVSAGENSPVDTEFKAYPRPEPKPVVAQPDDADSVFEGVISTWHEVPRCEVSALVTHEGPPCRRPAKWHLNLHGCLQLLICERGLQGWKRKQEAFLSQGHPLACVHCGQIFERFDDACSITRL
jgi:integrase